MSQYCKPELVFTPSPVTLVGPAAAGLCVVVWANRSVADNRANVATFRKRILMILSECKHGKPRLFCSPQPAIRGRRRDYSRAMTSISTKAFLGRAATSTVERAGGEELKYLPYTSFIVANSDRFLRKTVQRTTFPRPLPAAARIAERLRRTRSVCAATSPVMRCSVAGSIAICPEQKTNPPALMACE